MRQIALGVIPSWTRQVHAHPGIDDIERRKHLRFPRIAPEFFNDVIDSCDDLLGKDISCRLAIRLQFPVFIRSEFLFLGQFGIVFGNRVPQLISPAHHCLTRFAQPGADQRVCPPAS